MGRLPGITLCGTTSAAVPSAATSSAVLPKASAAVWAKKLDMNRSCTSSSPSTRACCGSMKPMKSAGTSSGSLVQQLVEGVLAVGARLTPEHLARRQR